MSTKHFARPAPSNGRTPTKGTHPCAVCGQPVHRVGEYQMSDGVKGAWKHVSPGAICAICGHIRNLHETVDRARCGQCVNGGRVREAQHRFEPEPAYSPYCAAWA